MCSNNAAQATANGQQTVHPDTCERQQRRQSVIGNPIPRQRFRLQPLRFFGEQAHWECDCEKQGETATAGSSSIKSGQGRLGRSIHCPARRRNCQVPRSKERSREPVTACQSGGPNSIAQRSRANCGPNSKIDNGLATSRVDCCYAGFAY